MFDVKISIFEKIEIPIVSSFISRIRFNKSNVRILFIDDEIMPIVENLRKAGWSVEKTKDIKNIDDDAVRRARIIFVDYKGVGRNISPQYEGVGLIKNLKDTYKKTKRVILYSANDNFPKEIVLNPIFQAADNRLPKNADTIEFLDMINMEIKKLR